MLPPLHLLEIGTPGKRGRGDDWSNTLFKKLKAVVDASDVLNNDALVEILVPYLAHACSNTSELKHLAWEPKLLASLCRANKQLAALCRDQDIWKQVLEYQVVHELPGGRAGERPADNDDPTVMLAELGVANWREAVLRRCNPDYWTQLDLDLTEKLLSITIGSDATRDVIEKYLAQGARPLEDTLARRLNDILDRHRPSDFDEPDREEFNRDMEKAQFVLDTMNRCDMDVNTVFPGAELVGDAWTTTLLTQLSNAAIHDTGDKDYRFESIITWLIDKGARVGVVEGVSELYMPFAAALPKLLSKLLVMGADVNVLLDNFLDPTPFDLIFPILSIYRGTSPEAEERRRTLLTKQRQEIRSGTITWSTMIGTNHDTMYLSHPHPHRKVCENIVNTALKEKRSIVRRWLYPLLG